MSEIREFDIVPPSQVQGVQLARAANSILVQNPSGAWYYLPDQNTFIPPQTGGMVVPANAVTTATILYQAPVGVSQAPNVDGFSALMVKYYSDFLPPASGVISPSVLTPGSNAVFLNATNVAPATHITLKAASVFKLTPTVANGNSNCTAVVLSINAQLTTNQGSNTIGIAQPLTIPTIQNQHLQLNSFTFIFPAPAGTRLQFVASGTNAPYNVAFYLVY